MKIIKLLWKLRKGICMISAINGAQYSMLTARTQLKTKDNEPQNQGQNVSFKTGAGAAMKWTGLTAIFAGVWAGIYGLTGQALEACSIQNTNSAWLQGGVATAIVGTLMLLIFRKH